MKIIYWLLKPVNLNNFASDHRPVLLPETLRLLNPKIGESYLDATAGGGGHAREIAKILDSATITLIDADPQVIANLTGEFAGATLYNNHFFDQMKKLKDQDLNFDMILADLGLSSLQLNDPARGFSFRYPASLDMRFNPQSDLSLAQRLDQVDAEQLASILRQYGQERHSRPIANAIKTQRPQTTTALAELVTSIKNRRGFKRRLHPATQTFMALRIWVNDELSQLAGLLEIAPQLLNPGGRLAIISFHSLEDRLVKRAFKDLSQAGYESSYFLKTKKPIIPPIGALATHPQARSAKLRVLERFK